MSGQEGGAAAGPALRGEYIAVLVVLAAAAGALLAASGQEPAVPSQGEVAGPPGAGGSGDALSPAGRAAGWVGLAAVAAIPATRGWARRGIGAVVAILGAASAAGLWFGSGPVMPAGIDPVWPAAAAAGAVVLFLAGTVVLVRGPRWPAMGARYDRHDGRRAVPRDDDPTALWNALSSGVDPTDDRSSR